MDEQYDPKHDEALPEDAKELAVDLFYSPAENSGPKFGSLKDYIVLTELEQGRYGPILLARSAFFARRNFVVLKEVRLQPPTSPDESERVSIGHSDAPATAHRRLDIPFDIVREFCLHEVLISRARAQGVHPLIASYGILADPRPGLGVLPGQEQIESIFLVLDHSPFTLSSLIDFYDESGEQFNLASIKFLFLQMLQGLGWLHSQGIVHRDLTPGNILIDAQGHLMLADLGEARQYERAILHSSPLPSSLDTNTETNEHHSASSTADKTSPDNPRMAMTRRRTTLWWRAPEVCLGATNYGPGADMWSAGCILAEMLLLEPVLQGDTDLHMLDLMTKLLGPPSEQDMHAFKGINADPIDIAAWTDSRQQVQGNGSLELKFNSKASGGGGPHMAEMLRTLLAWSPENRITAYEAVLAASVASQGAVRESQLASVVASWWFASPRAEDALFQADTAVGRLTARWEEFASRFDSVKVPRRDK